ncbi:predicted protein [Lichtheimia corymbifera JMRC:FSU:9682]|uniref:Uncharacterized protein n=1 Tax=Lichtheimia corymbifera JMRC:FSU:9682 TaxID=1263082 RepID=A0A068RYL0_9FUNG|nr:predicted protein [Lichtheimia corymbifera JMRC:FSU:9682]
MMIALMCTDLIDTNPSHSNMMHDLTMVIIVEVHIHRQASSSLPLHKASVQPQLGEQVVIDDSFRMQTFNNKYARDIPMTQASIPIQRFSVLSYIQDLIGASRVLIHGCHTRRGSGLNMLDIGASDGTWNIAIVAHHHHFMRHCSAAAHH